MTGKLTRQRRGTIASLSARSRRDFLRVGELCFALAMRCVPRRFRFAAALFVARATVPLFRKTEAYRKQQIMKFLSPREIVLFLLLNGLTRNSTPFNLKIIVNGYDHFARAYSKGKGILVIGHHAALTLFMVRFFYDNGFDPIVISPDCRLRVAGTSVTARTVQPSPMFLVQLRSRLRRGELVCAMPDRAEHHGSRTVEFATAAGQVILAPAMIQVAARCGAELVFTEVRVEGGQLVATIGSPAPSSAGSAPAITEDFISFVRDCTTNPPQSHGEQEGWTEKSRLGHSDGLATADDSINH